MARQCCTSLDDNRFRKYFWLTWMIQNRHLAICGIHIYPVAEKQKTKLLAETTRTPDAESSHIRLNSALLSHLHIQSLLVMLMSILTRYQGAGMQVAVVEKTFRIVGKGSLMAQFTLYLFRHTAYLVSGCGPADGGPLQRVAYRRLHHYLYQWPPSRPAPSTLVLNPPSR